MTNFDEHEIQIKKSLLTLVRSNKLGLQIQNLQDCCLLIDRDLGPQDILLYPKLVLYQVTVRSINLVLHRTDIESLQRDTYGVDWCAQTRKGIKL